MTKVKIDNNKWQYAGNPQIVLFLRLGIVLCLMILSRVLLFFFNTNLFPSVTPLLFLKYVINGIRFDLVALLYVNLLYIILMVLPFKFRCRHLFKTISNTIFYITNAIVLIPNFIDVIYYRFTLKRMTSDIFSYISTGSDIVDMIPTFFADFWYILLLWVFFVVVLISIAKRIQIADFSLKHTNINYYITQSVAMLLFAGFTLLGIRGGVQLKPLSILHASQYAPPNNTALVLNSAFTLIRSSNQHGIPQVAYFSNTSDMEKLFSIKKNYALSRKSVVEREKSNIVIIILESFSLEHIGELNQQGAGYGFTPFLDSLIKHSTVYKGFANGKRSIEGIPAIVASIPTWMTEDFITSPYSSNHYQSLASILKSEGYGTSFFHGGKNGTMGFDGFCLASGFDKYYGKNEYPNQSDFDGYWGIWDEPYLQYIAKELNNNKQPFFASFFTLSSHHPYNIPPQYSTKFKKGKLPIQQAIMYSDYALQRFFQTVSTMDWFKNTLFVITADHTSEAFIPYFQTRVGQYAIPIIFYKPDEVLPMNLDVTAQQVDIMPSILDYLNYNKPFVSFGNSLFSTSDPHFNLTFIDNTYQLIQDGYCLQSDMACNPIALYHYESDSLLNNNILKKTPDVATRMMWLTKSIVQQYNNSLINNKLTIK